jgi:hypothetical protein
LPTIVDPVWKTPGYNTTQGRPLVLRHPGFGWIGFEFPEKEATAIADWFTRDLPKRAR